MIPLCIEYKENSENTMLIIGWFDVIEHTLDNHIDAYKATLDIIYEARRGKLLAALLNREQLSILEQHINDANVGYTFPIPKLHIRPERLADIAEISLGDKNRKFLIGINIPLLELRPYEFYTMHPFPIPQPFSENHTASAYIVSISTRIAVSEDKTTYTFMDDAQVQACTQLLYITFAIGTDQFLKKILAI